MVAMLILAVLFAIVVAVVFMLSWALRWPTRTSRWPVVAGLYACTIVIIGAAWFIGLLSPIYAYVADRQSHALEQHLYLGEPRTELEKQFGHGIPKPDRISLGAGAYSYEYISAQAMCMQEYRGFTVEYSLHGDYIVSWRPVSDGDGC